MRKLSEYWSYREEVSMGQFLYAAYQKAKCQVGELAVLGFEQLSIPIEAAMEEETAEGLYLVD